MSADAADQRLVDAVRPSDWINPQPPRRRYHLVVVGGGTAGLVAAMGAAGLGARVALVERRLLGGDCLITGCVPSKAILRSARAAAEVRGAARLGIVAGAVQPEFAAVMRRMRERRADIAPHDSAQRLRAAGVDVYFGEARFSGRESIAVDDRRLTFWRAVIATGGRPAIPPIPGLSNIPFLTSETLFELNDLPPRLAIIGAGAIGCEIAQAFARLGSEVVLVDETPRVLANEDPDASAILASVLARDGVVLQLGDKVTAVASAADGVEVRAGGRTVLCDRLLVATGRTPNLERLDLAAAGVATDGPGVIVDDRLRTSNRRIFAAGDVSSRLKFTHAADATARIVVQNALFFGRARASALVIPRCTYTDPEVAHVGASLDDMGRNGRRVDTITIPLDTVDRAVVDDDREGFVRVHHERGRLLACTVVSPRAGELIGVATDLLRRGATLNDLAATIYPYPTLTQAFRAAGDAYRRTRLTPAVRAMLARYFRLM